MEAFLLHPLVQGYLLGVGLLSAVFFWDYFARSRGNDHVVRLGDLSTGKEIRSYEGHE